MLVALSIGGVSASGCTNGDRVMVRFSGEPADALVTIDDRYVGKLGRLSKSGIRLPRGAHRVTIDQVGFFPHDELVEVGGGRTITVTVKLTPVPD